MYNLPNLLTLSRIAAIPLVVLLMYIPGPWGAWSAATVYALACITDWLDGHIARQRQLQSDFGRFLDPIADKLLVAAILLVLVAQQQIAGVMVVAALIILGREILVSGLREFLAGLRISVPVSRLAKWKTAIQMVALGVVMVGPYGPRGFYLEETGMVGLALAALLTLITGYDYLRAGLSYMDRPKQEA
jgi:cardiolipin synthase (CMP-forming)